MSRRREGEKKGEGKRGANHVRMIGQGCDGVEAGLTPRNGIGTAQSKAPPRWADKPVGVPA